MVHTVEAVQKLDKKKLETAFKELASLLSVEEAEEYITKGIKTDIGIVVLAASVNVILNRNGYSYNKIVMMDDEIVFCFSKGNRYISADLAKDSKSIAVEENSLNLTVLTKKDKWAFEGDNIDIHGLFTAGFGFSNKGIGNFATIPTVVTSLAILTYKPFGSGEFRLDQELREKFLARKELRVRR